MVYSLTPKKKYIYKGKIKKKLSNKPPLECPKLDEPPGGYRAFIVIAVSAAQYFERIS